MQVICILIKKMSKNSSWLCLQIAFLSEQRIKPKHFQFYIIAAKDKQDIVTFLKLEAF